MPALSWVAIASEVFFETDAQCGSQLQLQIRHDSATTVDLQQLLSPLTMCTSLTRLPLILVRLTH